jgi:photosystem II stability/assembly factor-like uncharacterized protein
VIYHTANGGNKWDSTSIDLVFVQLDFTSPSLGYALSENTLHKTLDGGRSWFPLQLPGNPESALYFLDSLNGLVSGAGRLFKTADGGETWASVLTEGYLFLDYFFISSSVVVAVAYGAKDYQCIWKSVDGGMTWKNVFDKKGFCLNAIFFVNKKIGWVAGYYDDAGLGKVPVIVNTTDGGETWSESYRNEDISGYGEPLTDIRFKNELDGYALSRHNYDVFTTDGGVTWQLMSDSQELSETPVYGLFKMLDGVNDLYLIGESGSVAVWK